MEFKQLDLTNAIIEINRIGYESEGVRLTVANEIPFHFHAEVQLSQGDCRFLIKALQEILKQKFITEIPKGKVK